MKLYTYIELCDFVAWVDNDYHIMSTEYLLSKTNLHNILKRIEVKAGKTIYTRNKLSKRRVITGLNQQGKVILRHAKLIINQYDQLNKELNYDYILNRKLK